MADLKLLYKFLLLFSLLLFFQATRRLSHVSATVEQHKAQCSLGTAVCVRNFNSWTTIPSTPVSASGNQLKDEEEKASCARARSSMRHAVSTTPSCAKGKAVVLPNADHKFTPAAPALITTHIIRSFFDHNLLLT